MTTKKINQMNDRYIHSIKSFTFWVAIIYNVHGKLSFASATRVAIFLFYTPLRLVNNKEKYKLNVIYGFWLNGT